MFIVILTYVRPLAEVDALLEEHRRFLDGLLADGTLLFAGRREPRVGGVVVARASSAAELRARLDADPFARAGVATYELVEVVPTKVAPALAAVLT
jgi:uncharacterized protein YciI